MIYLIDPNTVGNACTRFCSTKCGIKPLYGVPGPIEV